MRVVLALAGKEIRLLCRDRHALAVLLAVPALFMLLMSLALSGLHREVQLRLLVQVAAPDAHSAFLAAALQAQLPASTVQHGVGHDGDAPPHGQIRLPADFSAQPPGAAPQLSFAPRTDARTRARVRAALGLALAQTRLSGLLEAGGLPDAASTPQERLAQVQQYTQSRVDEQQQRSDGTLVARANASQLNVPGWLIFGMFFVALPMAGGFERERQSGVLLRLRCLELPPSSLLWGKLLPYLLLNLFQFVLLLGVGVFGLPLVGLERLPLHGQPLAWAVLALCLSLCCCGLGLLLAALVRSAEQAHVLATGSNLMLAAVGGIMVPRSLMPPGMAALAEYSPMSWAHDAFLTLLVGQGTLADVAPWCARLAGLAWLLGATGLLLLHRRIRHTQWTSN